MLKIRRSDDRGSADHGWLKAKHSFSFADYYDPDWMGYSVLRVINEDKIAPGAGFGTHGHRDMEIITYVLDGAIAHKDSMGNGSVIRPGDVQRMSAGRGVLHSEFNQDRLNQTHMLQIWIEPDVRGVEPSYEEKHFDARDKRGRLKLIASPKGDEGSVRLHQNARLYAGLFDADEWAELELESGRKVYVHVARGRIEINDQSLHAGDALIGDQLDRLQFRRGEDAEVLVFDLP